LRGVPGAAVFAADAFFVRPADVFFAVAGAAFGFGMARSITRPPPRRKKGEPKAAGLYSPTSTDMPNPEVDFLTQSDLFANQARVVLDAVLSQGTFEKFGPGAVVFKQGEPGDRMYVIKSGVLEVITQPVDNTPAVTVAFLGVGEVVGELALLTGSPRSATIRCPENAELFRLDKAVFDDLMGSLPGMARSMCEVIARRLEATTLKSRRAETKQLSGNLEFFDLATVIQTLIGSHQTGSLVVSSPKHERVSEIVFFKGNIVRALFQKLKGDDAVFQLFQSKPEGDFAFTSREAEEQQGADITLPGISLLMEAIRMSDELPILQEQFPDRKKIHKARVADLVWTDSESLPAARDVFKCLQKGASIDDLERESGRCSFWVFKVLSTLHGAGQIE
jgi:CRP-like cAMP-binding protein